MEYWQTFKESWKLGRRFWIVALLDILFYAVIAPCFLLYVYVVNRQAGVMQSVLGTNDVASYLASASQFEISAMSGSLKTFVLTFIGGAVILLIISLFAYSLSRSLIWNYLLKLKFNSKKYLKFILFNLIMFIALAIIFTAYSLVAVLNRWVFSVITVFLVLAVVYYVFNAEMLFTKTGKIFESIGNAFKQMNRNVYLLCLIPFIAVMLINYGLNFVLTPVLNTVLSAVLIIVLSSWMRIFILNSK